jgi:hypothetical protein
MKPLPLFLILATLTGCASPFNKPQKLAYPHNQGIQKIVDEEVGSSTKSLHPKSYADIKVYEQLSNLIPDDFGFNLFKICQLRPVSPSQEDFYSLVILDAMKLAPPSRSHSQLSGVVNLIPTV